MKNALQGLGEAIADAYLEISTCILPEEVDFLKDASLYDIDNLYNAVRMVLGHQAEETIIQAATSAHGLCEHITFIEYSRYKTSSAIRLSHECQIDQYRICKYITLFAERYYTSILPQCRELLDQTRVSLKEGNRKYRNCLVKVMKYICNLLSPKQTTLCEGVKSGNSSSFGPHGNILLVVRIDNIEKTDSFSQL